jgi:hypothetical protein
MAGAWGGVAPKRNVFLGKNFAGPTKEQKILPSLKYQLKNK